MAQEELPNVRPGANGRHRLPKARRVEGEQTVLGRRHGSPAEAEQPVHGAAPRARGRIHGEVLHDVADEHSPGRAVQEHGLAEEHVPGSDDHVDFVTPAALFDGEVPSSGQFSRHLEVRTALCEAWRGKKHRTRVGFAVRPECHIVVFIWSDNRRNLTAKCLDVLRQLGRQRSWGVQHESAVGKLDSCHPRLQRETHESDECLAHKDARRERTESKERR
mmetsp:Transcript_14891/g.50209  ORF Transcript_14891/g.50209 Transcript_14891/m.50209 type:complete len:219 (+) Transcript_14891:1508-2164(+)